MTNSYTHGIYISGIDPTNLPDKQIIQQKLGQAGTNLNRSQRLAERQRQVPNAIEHAFFPTHEGDKSIRDYLCDTLPLKFGRNRGAGHDVIDLKVEDFKLLIDITTRYFNAVNNGLDPKEGKLHSWAMRQEQKDCLVKTIAFFQDPTNDGREFLWDCKMRFGKTHTAYQVAKALDAKLILILTGRPSDTKDSWIDATDHVAFPNFNKRNVIDASKQTTAIVPFANGEATIVFASLQDMVSFNPDGSFAFKEKFKHFSSLQFDLLIKDECHLAFDTKKTKTVLSKLNFKKALNLSGTPFRALLEEQFTADQIYSWSYLNEQIARLKEIETLGYTQAEEEGEYFDLCPMKLFNIALSDELYQDASSFTEEEGFTFAKLFATEYRDGRFCFKNELAVSNWLDAMCQGMVMPFSKQAHNSYQYQSISLQHSLWCVPGVAEAELLKDLMSKHRFFKDYDIIVAAGRTNNGEGNNTVQLVKGRIADIISGRNQVHRGTITITCGKLIHGVSIPEWGSIFNLSDMKSAQLYFQLCFRSQTPWKHMKRECYVFDFNPNRTLTHLQTLAEAIANTGDIKIVITEILRLFNVLCYDGNGFKSMDASELISKLDAIKATTLTGLQSLMSGLMFDWDDEMDEGIEDIDLGGSSKKDRDIDVNNNDGSPNGKNSKQRKDKGDVDDSPNDDKKKEDEELAAAEKKRQKYIEGMRAFPLYYLMTRDASFDDVVSNIESNPNYSYCKKITGLLPKNIKKILNGQSQDKKRVINQSLIKYRVAEEQDHNSFQDENNFNPERLKAKCSIG